MVTLGHLFQSLSPHARLATAVAPFLLAVILRFLFGSGRAVNWMLTLSSAWFVMNVFMAPYSQQMRQDILNLRGWLR